MTAPVALVCGHVTLDVAGGAAVPGGTAYYAAHALAALGAHVRVFTSAGADFPAGALRAGPPAPVPSSTPTAAPPRAGTIDALVLPSPATTTFENADLPGGRRAQRVLAVAPPLEPGRLPADWREADLVLLGPVAAEVDPSAFTRTLRARLVGLCLQGLVRRVLADGAVVPGPLRAGALAGIAAAFLGDDEEGAQPGLGEEVAASVPLVAITHGVRGSEVRAGPRRWRAGVHPARALDPTGAGDVFAAAFLLALWRGDAPPGAARLAAAAASIAVEGRGGEALDRIGEAWERARGVDVEEA